MILTIMEIDFENDEDSFIEHKKQMRCASHTLNLIASCDAVKTRLQSSAYKRAYDLAMSKIKALWNKLSDRGTKSCDTVEDVCGFRFPTPGETCWNAQFDCISFDSGPFRAYRYSITGTHPIDSELKYSRAARASVEPDTPSNHQGNR